MSEPHNPKGTQREGISFQSIRLADGLDWGFAAPSRLIRPKLVLSYDKMGRPLENLRVEVGFGYPLSIRRSIDRLKNACQDNDLTEQYEAFISLAVHLLLRVHDISESMACQLLTVPEDDLPKLVACVVHIISSDETSEFCDDLGDKAS